MAQQNNQRATVSSQAEVQGLLLLHPEEEHVRVKIARIIASVREGKVMHDLLREKIDTKRWSVIEHFKLEPVAHLHDEFAIADRLLMRLIARTDPATAPPAPRARALHYFNINGSPLRIAGLNAAAAHRRRLKDLANRGALSASSSTRKPNTRAGIRHRTPHVVPIARARELVDAGNGLKRCSAAAISHVGRIVGDVGMALLRKNGDRTTLHGKLVEARAELLQVWGAELRLDDLI